MNSNKKILSILLEEHVQQRHAPQIQRKTTIIFLLREEQRSIQFGTVVISKVAKMSLQKTSGYLDGSRFWSKKFFSLDQLFTKAREYSWHYFIWILDYNQLNIQHELVCWFCKQLIITLIPSKSFINIAPYQIFLKPISFNDTDTSVVKDESLFCLVIFFCQWQSKPNTWTWFVWLFLWLLLLPFLIKNWCEKWIFEKTQITHNLNSNETVKSLKKIFQSEQC